MGNPFSAIKTGASALGKLGGAMSGGGGAGAGAPQSGAQNGGLLSLFQQLMSRNKPQASPMASQVPLTFNGYTGPDQDSQVGIDYFGGLGKPPIG